MQGNIHMVAARGKSITLMRPPRPAEILSADAALELAAWLVALAEIHATRKFDEVLVEVQNT